MQNPCVRKLDDPIPPIKKELIMKVTVTDFEHGVIGHTFSYYGTIGKCPKCKRIGAVKLWTKKQKTKKNYPERGKGITFHKYETDGLLGIPIDYCEF